MPTCDDCHETGGKHKCLCGITKDSLEALHAHALRRADDGREHGHAGEVAPQPRSAFAELQRGAKQAAKAAAKQSAGATSSSSSSSSSSAATTSSGGSRLPPSKRTHVLIDGSDDSDSSDDDESDTESSDEGPDRAPASSSSASARPKKTSKQSSGEKLSRRKRSVAHFFFVTGDNGQHECLLECGFVSNEAEATTHRLNHLKKKHKSVWAAFKKAEKDGENIETWAKEAIRALPKPKAKQVKLEDFSKRLQVPPARTPSGSTSAKDTGLKKLVGQALLIIDGGSPFNAFTHTEKFLGDVANMEQLTYREYVTTIDVASDLVERQQRENLSKCETVAVLSDLWTSLANHTMLGVVIRGTDPDFETREYATGVVCMSGLRKTSENMALLIDGAFERFFDGAERKPLVSMGVSDNEASALRAARLFADHVIGCSDHSLVLALRGVIGDGTQMGKANAQAKHAATVLIGVNELGKRLANSPKEAHALSLIMDNLDESAMKFKRLYANRWKGVFDSIDSAVNMEKSLLEYVAPIGGVLKTTDGGEIVIDQEFFGKLRMMRNVLAPVTRAIDVLQRRDTHVGVIPVTIKNILRDLKVSENDSLPAVELKRELGRAISERFVFRPESPAVCAALLDPAYANNHGFPDNFVAEAWGVIKSEVDVFTEKEAKQKLMAAQLEYCKSQLRDLAGTPPGQLPSAKEFYTGGDGELRVLAPLARMYFGIPAGTAAVERVFSDAGNVDTPKRNRLDPQRLAKLVTIKRHMRDVDRRAFRDMVVEHTKLMQREAERRQTSRVGR